ncbi:sugar phosphate isomerase/epimerase [Pseudaminobacter sp. 19-2017]|uniref:Sugar phosphate isomerase/epimerase n=1 Tax=Pseudaminobacter soli (ex Zhang et al. 2022) TaxID=2831468 RepID=A0A942E0P7_9HYPH|nr:sugar phosphate isomerase/epimerase [Pseudaminobacter soli]MBS3651226.1 sugar phosphate isomerase/epimerase [Pseudaminobacter soli]
MNWSFQLYSARNFQPWPDVLKTLAELGYRNVEGFGGVYADPAGFRADLDRNGLAMPSGHFPIEMLEGDFGKAQSIATTLGMKLIACPYLQAPDRPIDAEGWRGFGRRLAAVSQRAKDAGFDFAWHNHDFEFKPLPDGSTPQARIFEGAPDLGWEIDVAWVIRGGAEPMKWINDHDPQIVAVHVKDIARPGEGLDEDGWSDVGHGTVDWKGLVAALKSSTPAKYYIMEQDNPNDFRRFAARSLETVKAF